MKKRIGNDITFSWHIYRKNGDTQTPESFAGKDVEVKLISPLQRPVTIEDVSIATGVVTFTFRGKHQVTLGNYVAVLLENKGEDGMVTIDVVNAVTLVPHSYMEEDGDDGDVIEAEAVELTSTISSGGGGGMVQQQADWAQTDATAVDYIKNKPDLGLYVPKKDDDGHGNMSIYGQGTITMTLADKQGVINQTGTFYAGGWSVSSPDGKFQTFGNSIYRGNIGIDEDSVVWEKTATQQIPAATTEANGLMSASDKSKLNALPTATELAQELGDKANSADLAEVATSGSYNDLSDKPDLSAFITKSVDDLTNYYLKSETYTKNEVLQLIGAIQQFHYEVYATLPQSGASNVLYLIGPIGAGADKYEEYVYANNNWTKIGDTSIDLSGYVTTEALTTALADYITSSALIAALANYYNKNDVDGLLAGKQDTIQDLDAIRRGSQAGATAVQTETLNSALSNTVAESGVYDVTANNNNAKFASLSALLSSENLNTLIPSAKRKGGMSIKFVQSSDNKYVQYRLMKNTWSTTVSDWQGVDDEPVVGSENLVKSGGVADSINQLKNAGYLYAGIVTPTTNPGTPDVPVFYIANGKGTYTNFGGINVTEDEVVVLYYDTVWHKDATGIASNDKLTELEGKMDGSPMNLLEGAKWEVGRIFDGQEINTTEYPNYRVLKFNCERGDKINVAATYTPTTVFIGYIREDNTVKEVVAGTGGAIEETTIECVTATYVVCEPLNAISNITTLVKVVPGMSTIVSNLESAVAANTQDITHIQTTLEPIDKKVNGGVNTIDIKPTLEWKDGRVFTSGINTTDYPNYKYAEIECKEGDKIRIAASYTPASSVFFGYKDGSRITQLIAGTGTGIDEQIFECINATYVVCQTVKNISRISVLEKTVKTDSAFEKLHKELTDEIVKKIDDAPIDSKQYVRKDGKWQEFKIGSKEPIVTDLLNSVEWKNGRVVDTWIDTSATYSKLCEIEITKDDDELIVASNTSGPANVPFLSKKTDATHAAIVISSTDGGAIPEQRIVCEKGVYIVCIYAHPTTDVTVLTKLEYPIDEQKEENKRNRGFLYGKTIASLGDSLATSGLWQNELVKKGAIFDAEKNYTAGQLNYSEGGTVTCDAKDANCGHIRARRLVEDGIVVPDVIFIENVNDSRLAPPPNHDTPSNIDDEPFFLTDVINYDTTYNSKQDAITAWENNFESIVGSVTAKKGVAFLLKYNVSAKVFTINSAPTQNGYIDITVTGNDVKRITLTASDTIATVIEKILAYDYSGWTDTKKSSDAVIFSPSITGDVDITANTCGLTFTKTTEESTNSIARCFCSVDVSKWNDKTVWKDNPGLFASYKGMVEYLQNAFPTSQIVFFIPETWGFNYNASIYKRADGTIDVDKIAKSYNYVGYLYNLQKQFCERYNLRVIDVRGKCGANYINISQFNAPDEVHPKELGYQRWGEQIVRELN